MHRYFDYEKVKNFEGKVMIGPTGDANGLSETEFERLEKAEDYLFIFFEDDISIRTKAEIEEGYKENEFKPEEKMTFKKWLMNRWYILVIVKEDKTKCAE